MENRIRNLMMRIARLERLEGEVEFGGETRLASKKLMMSSVTLNAIPDKERLRAVVAKILKSVDSSKRKWTVTIGHSADSLQTVIICKHNDLANSRFEQEVLVVKHQGTGNSSRSFKTMVTTGSQVYEQKNLATAVSFLVKVADAEKSEFEQARLSGTEVAPIRPVYEFSGRSSLKFEIPVALVVPDTTKLGKEVASLLKDKSKVRWSMSSSALDMQSNMAELTFVSSGRPASTKTLFVKFAGSAGNGAKFKFTSEGRDSTSLNVITTHMLSDKPLA